MKIYLASRFSNHEKLNALATTLTKNGHMVVSTWHRTEALSPVPRDHPEYLDNSLRAAERDLQEIDESDALILFTENCEATPGGLWFEAGYAKALGKQCFVIGPRINIFCHLCSEWQPSN
jgi:nucleoside 2-deoxyribosyltransferase